MMKKVLHIVNHNFKLLVLIIQGLFEGLEKIFDK